MVEDYGRDRTTDTRILCCPRLPIQNMACFVGHPRRTVTPRQSPSFARSRLIRAWRIRRAYVSRSGSITDLSSHQTSQPTLLGGFQEYRFAVHMVVVPRQELVQVALQPLV